jgi:hypothetical protein
MFCIRRSNKEPKQIACALWPSDPHDTSYRRLMDALSANRRQKLSVNEIVFIMHFCGNYDPLYFIADQCLHERPVRKSVELQQTEIKEQFEDMMATAMKKYQEVCDMTKKRDEIERIRQGNVTFLDIENGKISKTC